MRKTMIEKKNRIQIWAKAAALLLSAFVFIFSKMTGYAAEETAIYVYHQHTGNEKDGGGCYGQAVYHSHQGDEKAGGKCYETAIYHSHTGNQNTGGGCYQQPVYHVHEGDGNAPSVCYTAVYHEHTDNCYKEVAYDSAGCYVVKLWDSGNDDYTDASGKFHDYKYFQMNCGQTIYGTNAYHTHRVLNCKKEGTIEGYAICCGKTPETVEGYSMNCSKTPETIEGYALSCKKTEKDVEKYIRSCEKEEGSPCGMMRVNATATENNQKAILSVSFTDLTGGELQCGADAFLWYDKSGKELSKGTSIAVSENGTYQVTLTLEHENITPKSIYGEIQVSSIVKPTPPKQEKGGNSTGTVTGNSNTTQNNYQNDTEKEEQKENETGKKEESSEIGTNHTITVNGKSVSSQVQSKANNKSNQENIAILPTIAPDMEEEAASIGKIFTQTFHFPEEYAESDLIEETAKETPKASQMLAEEPITEQAGLAEEVAVEMQERQSEAEIVTEIQKLESEEGKSAFFEIKVLLLGAGTFAVVLCMVGGIFLLWRSVGIYNDDGQGNMFYLGRCLAYNEEDTYVISISDKMRERSETNKYCIKPGIFLLGRTDEEIIVERGHKRIFVTLQREMNVII